MEKQEGLTVDEAVAGFFGPLRPEDEGSAVRAFREQWRRCQGVYDASEMNWGFAKNVLILAMENQFSARKGSAARRQYLNLKNF